MPVFLRTMFLVMVDGLHVSASERGLVVRASGRVLRVGIGRSSLVGGSSSRSRLDVSCCRRRTLDRWSSSSRTLNIAVTGQFGRLKLDLVLRVRLVGNVVALGTHGALRIRTRTTILIGWKDFRLRSAAVLSRGQVLKLVLILVLLSASVLHALRTRKWARGAMTKREGIFVRGRRVRSFAVCRFPPTKAAVSQASVAIFDRFTATIPCLENGNGDERKNDSTNDTGDDND